MSNIELTINGKVFIHKFELHTYEHLIWEQRTDLRNEIVREEIKMMKDRHSRALSHKFWAYTIFVNHESKMNFGKRKD